MNATLVTPFIQCSTEETDEDATYDQAFARNYAGRQKNYLLFSNTLEHHQLLSTSTMSTQDLNDPINDIFGRRLSTEWISY
jgi:hypothetical protein